MLIKFTKIDPYQKYYTFNTSKGAPSKATTLVIFDLRIIIQKKPIITYGNDRPAYN